jgi:hypothetical protein
MTSVPASTSRASVTVTPTKWSKNKNENDDALTALLSILPSTLPSFPYHQHHANASAVSSSPAPSGSSLAHRVANSITRQHEAAQRLVHRPLFALWPTQIILDDKLHSGLHEERTKRENDMRHALTSMAVSSTSSMSNNSVGVSSVADAGNASMPVTVVGMTNEEFDRQRALWKTFFAAEKKASSGSILTWPPS